MEKAIVEIILLATISLTWFVLGRDYGFQQALKIVANGVKVVIENHMREEDEDEE